MKNFGLLSQLAHKTPHSLSNSVPREWKTKYRKNSYFGHSFSSQVLSRKLLS